MTGETPRWALPLLTAGQAQKEITHNEALTLLDLVVPPGVGGVGLATPPDAPVPGQAWVVGDQPVAAWKDRAAMLAGWTEGGWRFLPPRQGLSVWNKAEQCRSDWDGAAWRTGRVVARELTVNGKKVLGAQQSAIVQPDGGQVIDIEGRYALNAVISALRSHGLIASD